MANVTLTQLTDDDREQFILDNQRAFKFGAMEEFGNRDDHMEEDGEIISRKTIEDSIDGGAEEFYAEVRRTSAICLEITDRIIRDL